MLYDSFYEVLNLFVASALLGIALFLFKLFISAVFFTAEELVLTPRIILKVKKVSDLKSIIRSKSLCGEYAVKRIVSDILIVIFFALSLSLVLYICRDGRFSLYPLLIAMLCYRAVSVILSRADNWLFFLVLVFIKVIRVFSSITILAVKYPCFWILRILKKTRNQIREKKQNGEKKKRNQNTIVQNDENI